MNGFRSGLVAVALVVSLGALGSGCGKLSDAQKQDASDIASGLAGETGSSLSTSVGLTAPVVHSADTSRVGGFLRQQVEGVFWLTRFKVMEPSAEDLTLSDSTCAAGTGTGTCTGACNTAKTIYTATCTLPDGSGYSCNGTAYTFTSSSFSVSADFTNTGGAVGSATGSFVIGVSIQGNVSGGSLDGKQLKCGMDFTVDIAKLKAGTLKHFSPTCDGSFSCSYDGKDLGCVDVQTEMATSTLACS